ncbi:MAG: hypothetical protein H0X49_00625 [Acidobacteria bacterium]|nr:hypothetical protein [Acidobacteriota bacterium]
MKLENGTIINQYKIISSIGAGGMGEVYLDEIIKPNRKVVSKFLYQAIDDDKNRN